MLGGVASGTISSVNSFIEQFVLSRNESKCKWKALSFDYTGFSNIGHKNEEAERKLTLNSNEIAELFRWSLTISGTQVFYASKENLILKLAEMYHAKKEIADDGKGLGEGIKKINRPMLSNPYVAATTPTEKKLAEMIESFFGISNIGIHDNFFELGGDSLKAMILLKQIGMEFNVNFPLREFLQSQNVKDIASEIDNIKWLSKEDMDMNSEITI